MHPGVKRAHVGTDHADTRTVLTTPARWPSHQ